MNDTIEEVFLNFSKQKPGRLTKYGICLICKSIQDAEQLASKFQGRCDFLTIQTENRFDKQFLLDLVVTARKHGTFIPKQDPSKEIVDEKDKEEDNVKFRPWVPKIVLKMGVDASEQLRKDLAEIALLQDGPDALMVLFFV